MKTAAPNRKHGSWSTVLGKKKKRKKEFILEWVQRGFLSKTKGKVIPYWWTENRKGAGISSGESGVRNMEAESIKSRAENTGGRVKFKTVTKTEQCPWYIYDRQCLSCTEFFAGLGASGENETEVWCGQVYIYLFFNFSRRRAAVLYATKTLDRGSMPARKERIAVVDAWQNEWGDQFHCSLSGKTVPDRSNSTELVVARVGGLTDEVQVSTDSVLSRRTPRLLTES